jgi:signal transduction histidine kinase
VAQEALTNVARHASAHRVEIALSIEQAGVELSVRDDGAGITAGALSDPKSIGLLGMRERMQAVGGTVDVEGGPSTGTTVRARIAAEAASK